MTVRRTLLVLGVSALAAAGVLGAYALYRKHEFRDIRGSSSIEFVTTRARPAARPEGIAWPRYGYDLAGTRAAGYRLREGFQNAGSCCGAVVFVDQSAESVAALDLFAARWLVRVCRLGREERESAVRALAVVMAGLDAEH